MRLGCLVDHRAQGAGDGKGAALGLGLQDGHGVMDDLWVGQFGAQVLYHGLVVVAEVCRQGDCGLLWGCGLGC